MHERHVHVATKVRLIYSVGPYPPHRCVCVCRVVPQGSCLCPITTLPCSIRLPVLFFCSSLSLLYHILWLACWGSEKCFSAKPPAIKGNGFHCQHCYIVTIDSKMQDTQPSLVRKPMVDTITSTLQTRPTAKLCGEEPSVFKRVRREWVIGTNHPILEEVT